jgi:RNA polymerase sigma-54 factor
MLKTSLQLRMSQQLTMTPQLQQAIRLLQMPAIELQTHISELLESNIMLEPEDDHDPLTSFEALGATPNELPTAQPPGEDSEGGEDHDVAAAATEAEATVEVIDDVWDERSANASDSPYNSDDDDRAQEFSDAGTETLQEHLAWQLDMAKLQPRQLAIGRAILDAINDDGYLIDSEEVIADTLHPEIDASVEEVAAVIDIVQRFDPPGIAARSISECILLQLQLLDDDTPGLECAKRMAAHHLELMAQRDLAPLRRVLGCPDEEITLALALVRSCQPRPGSQVSAAKAEYVVPDVFVRRGPTGWTVEMNPATLPRVRVNQGYANMLGRGAGHANMRAQLQEARWLLKSLEIRQDTLIRVARTIVERQIAFLELGDEHMRPMILRDIAEAIGMHESTISRVTSGKYMHTPRGVFELRFFFSSHVGSSDGSETSSTAIRAKIRKLIREEQPGTPLSDSRIAELLSEEGIPVARRTVAKYREAMGIEPSNERKRALARV